VGRSREGDERGLETHFEFGRNWRRLVARIDEERVAAAVHDIATFMGRESLRGLSFLDIGCGSGLSSLAAYRLGARPIHSVDIDPVNIENVREVRRKFGVPEDAAWTATVASIVNADDAQRLPRSDVVYAWGVLHHTGDLWNALENSATLVRPGGYLYLMLYRDALLAPAWKTIKRLYVASPGVIQFLARNAFAALLVAAMLAKGRNPLQVIPAYGKSSRGMSWYVDVTDWMGGYPFEYVSAERVIAFAEARGFSLRNLHPLISRRPIGLLGTGNYRYLFQRAQT
jgi:2-polyprenyl-3-methyl-5-hydroxy-6-metoxy-1,4-benzoquinol methylase